MPCAGNKERYVVSRIFTSDGAITDHERNCWDMILKDRGTVMLKWTDKCIRGKNSQQEIWNWLGNGPLQPMIWYPDAAPILEK